MSPLRALLLTASRNPWLADQFRRRAFARRAVRRFMPGEDMEAALAAAAALAAERTGAVLTCLGERVAGRTDAIAVADHYVALINTIAARGLGGQVSVKLTHLGLDVDRDTCARNLDALAARARATGGFVWVDMEESQYVDQTLELFRVVRATHPTVGICLQAYLHRTPADLESLLPLTPAIRLVKGAYREPPDIALADKRDVDTAYGALADRLLERAMFGDVLPAFGTHDLRLIDRIGQRAGTLRLPPVAYEVHMLYGIKTAERRRLAAAGVVTRVLISYGTQWFAWYMRRLAERPANLWFVLRNIAP